MKSNINKLILIEVIAGILFAFIASKILHMTAALQIMYLPFELIGKGLRVSIPKFSNRKCHRDHHIRSHFNDTSNLYHLSEKKRKNTQRRHITCCIHRAIILFPVYVHQSRTHVSENARHFFNGPE